MTSEPSEIDAAYAACRRLHRRHDPTYYVATRCLPGAVRPATHALYGFVRGADEIVDRPYEPGRVAERAAALDAWHGVLLDGMARGRSAHPVIAALVDAGTRHDLPLGELTTYMRSMRRDLEPIRVATYAELDDYMEGSAGSVGRIMAALLGVPERHRDRFGALGKAFQLANFVRDVREDHGLGRVYLPAEDCERFGVAEDDLAHERPGPRVRALLAHEARRARELFAQAAPAIRSTHARVRPGIHLACARYGRVLTRAGAPRVTRRATLRGAERTPFVAAERSADVLVCGASFAGLAVARELAATGADVLVLDRYAIGERQTSACAAPTPWLRAMGVERSIRRELPHMGFATPHGAVRYRLPWSWSSFDYRTLCEELWAQRGERTRFEIATVRGRDGTTVHTDRGDVTAPLVVDALGWRRVLGPGPNVQPPHATVSRGLEVHPHSDRGGDSLDVWVDRSLVERGYGWSVPAAGDRRVGTCSYLPAHDVRAPTDVLAGRLGEDRVAYQGNYFPHALRDAVEDGVFFVGDSAGHCFPLSGEGIRTAFYFGIAAGREIAAVLAGEQSRDEALASYGAFSERHRPAFRRAARLQRLIPALPPRVLTGLLHALRPQPFVDRAFGWYLGQAAPAFASPPAGPR